MNIYESITSIISENAVITKNKRNQNQGFMYRGIDDVMNTFQPLFSKYHVFVVPEVLEQTRQERVTRFDEHGRPSTTLIYSVLRIKYTFYAEDGSSVSAVVVGEGMDSGDKASNKALAVGMKYAMFQVFCIPTEEMIDPDSQSHPSSTQLPSYTKHEQPPAAPQHPAQQTRFTPPDIKYRCEECGVELNVYAGADGKPVGLRKHAEGSKAKFGKVLCLECIAKRQAADMDGAYQEALHGEAGDRL